MAANHQCTVGNVGPSRLVSKKRPAKQGTARTGHGLGTCHMPHGAVCGLCVRGTYHVSIAPPGTVGDCRKRSLLRSQSCFNFSSAVNTRLGAFRGPLQVSNNNNNVTFSLLGYGTTVPGPGSRPYTLQCNRRLLLGVTTTMVPSKGQRRSISWRESKGELERNSGVPQSLLTTTGHTMP
eukprot:2530985-Rhodomonas_salina.1